MTIQVNPDEPFHVVREGNVVTMSLEQLDTAYQYDAIQEETLIWQEGFNEWMRLDTLLYTLEQQEGPVAPIPELEEDIYYVMVAPEEVKQMSLDLLADAYRLDVIDDQTLVWQPGFTEWLPIGALLGPEDDHVSIAPSMPPAYNGGLAPSAPAQEAPAFNFGSVGPIDDSLAPAADWSIIPQPERTSPWYGRGLIAMAALGAFFVSYRAGAVESAADEFEQRSLLSQVESKVGPPGVDTVQGLDRWLAELEKTHGLDALAETDPIPGQKATPKADDEAKKEDAKKADADGEKKAKPQAKSDAEKKKEASEKKADDKANAFSSVLKGEPKPAAAAPAKKRISRPSNTSGIKWKGPAGDPNDPMNGAL